jgi:glycine/D-amino acid oxidase-like deaminating enzyme
LIVGGGLFGSLAAAWARRHGVEAIVFDAGLPGAASHAAAGLFCERWAGRRFRGHFQRALPLLEQLYEVRPVTLTVEGGLPQQLLFVPPAVLLEPAPMREHVTVVGDGWLEAGGQRYEGWVYIAAGIWCEAFLPGLGVYGKAGSALQFAGESRGRMRVVAPGRQSLAFVRDPGMTYFSDGTAERVYTAEHDLQTRERARAMGFLAEPSLRLWGQRPYVPGGPVIHQLAARTWLATGGRKLGTILGASFARRLVEVELTGRFA